MDRGCQARLSPPTATSGRALISVGICLTYLQPRKFKEDYGRLILGRVGKSDQEYSTELSVYPLFSGFVSLVKEVMYLIRDAVSSSNLFMTV